MDKEILNKKIQRLVNHFHAGDYAYALRESHTLLKKLPNNIFLMNLIGSCYQNLGNLKTASDTFVHIINLDNKNFAAYNNLGNIFKAQKKFEDAERNYNKALEINPKYENAMVNLGNLYFEINDYQKAIDYYLKSLKINNQNALAYYNLGLVYQSIGEFNDSHKAFKEALKINPTNTNADKMISRSTKYTKDNSHLEKMREKLKKLKLNEPQKTNLYFSLGKAYEDLEDFEESFKYLKLANDTKKKFIQRNFENEYKTFKNLKTFFKENEIHNRETSKKKIIFILGLPRSGTSLVEQIISSHSEVYGCGELDYINKIIRNNLYKNNILDKSKLKNIDQNKINNMSKEYLDLVEKFDSTSTVFTDKAPLNFAWIGIIRLILPNSKIIHCSRNPKDNILSLYKNDFDDRLNFTYDLNDLVQFYKEYRDLMTFWTQKFQNEIYNANYEKILTNPHDEIKSLLNFCDLNFENNCLDFYKTKRPIKTVSSAQARQPIYKSSMASYKKYEKYMKEFFDFID